MTSQGRTRVCVVGSGWLFTSGISYYTCRLSGALTEPYDVSALLMRKLIPRALYPGKDRVGEQRSALAYDPAVKVLDGVDWFWGLSLWRAARFLRRESPDVLLMQWWTGAVLHSYLVLVLLARSRGAKVLLEFHEVQDTGEARVPLAGLYTKLLGGLVIRLSAGALVHSEFDREAVARSYPLGDKPVVVAPHGPYDHHLEVGPVAPAEPGVVRVLFFGTVRPYKGLEHLVEAFQGLTDEEAAGFRLSIVGETWEGWDAPIEAARTGRHADRITVVNHYVHDDEVAASFAGADAVVLPYLRSSASGPLHIAMAAHLPVVLSDVGGLREAAEGYTGVTWVPPGDVEALRAALRALPGLVGVEHDDPRSWGDTVAAVTALIERA